jgi:hypothetical protein
VTVDGMASSGGVYTQAPAKRSMFGGFSMGSIPENITFASPGRKYRYHDEDDDDSTIATAEQHHQYQQVTGQAKEDDDDDESSWDSNLMDVDNETTHTELENLRKQIEQLKDIVSGVYQTRPQDSNKNSAKTSIPGGAMCWSRCK